MRKLLIVALLLNAGFLFAIWQQLSVVAEVGSGAGVDSPCGSDATQYSLDSNADGAVDLSDFVYGLSWLFSGTEAPRVCLATNDDVEARLVALERAVGAFDDSFGGLQARQDATEIQTTANSDNISAISFEVAKTYDGFLGVLDRVGIGDALPNEFSFDDLALEHASTLQWMLILLKRLEFIPTDEFLFIDYNTQGQREYEHIATRQGGQIGTGLVFVLLYGSPTGFMMGSGKNEFGHQDREFPRHYVQLNPFLIAKYEVTQFQYEILMGVNDSAEIGDFKPVTNVSWDDLHAPAPSGFLAKYYLSLPTEAQWEYACRAGTPGPYSGTGNLDDMGWWDGNSDGVLRPVGTKQANQLGLHDMHGNVYEWCEDVYDSDFYNEPEAQLPNPLATSGSTARVNRGGGFVSDAQFARSANRLSSNPSLRSGDLGFRPARLLP